MANKNTNPVPTLTIEERRAALDKAMETRRQRAEIKEQLRKGVLDIEQLLNMDSDAAKRIKVYDAIRCIKGVGERKAYKIMDDLGIAYSRRIGGLGKRQKAKLLAFIESREQK